MCLMLALLSITPFLRHCETSHGRYMAVLMQTEVKDVPLSIPSFSSDLGISLNYARRELSHSKSFWHERRVASISTKVSGRSIP